MPRLLICLLLRVSFFSFYSWFLFFRFIFFSYIRAMCDFFPPDFVFPFLFLFFFLLTPFIAGCVLCFLLLVSFLSLEKCLYPSQIAPTTVKPIPTGLIHFLLL